MLLGALLPAGAPDALEGRGQTRQLNRRPARQEVRDAVDQRRHQRRIRGRTGLEPPEQGDDTVNVDQKDRRLGEVHLGMDATLPRRKVLKWGTLGTDDRGACTSTGTVLSS